VLAVMPDGTQVTLLGDTQTADGYLWRRLTYNAQTGWAAARYLVFNPPQAAPAPPITLRQLQSDRFSPIAAGGSVNALPVILAATPSGPSGQQFNIQAEVRPSGTAFSGPTLTGSPLQGGSEAQLPLTILANQGYHWRARTIDGYGQASDWVQFSGNTTDFTVNAPSLPSALFVWAPAQVFTGDAIQFTANANSSRGLAFSWDFGGGQNQTGGTVSQTFAQGGNVTVTLTVTDSQEHQATHTETVSVLSHQILDAINRIAQQAENTIDSMVARAQACANAAEQFQEDVNGVPSSELGLIFD